MNILAELRYTLKILLKNYKFTFLCSSVLAIGIAIVLPIYSIYVNFGSTTPDFPDGERYVALQKELTSTGRAVSSRYTYDAYHYRYFKEKAASFTDLYAGKLQSLTISDGEYAEVFSGSVIEPALLTVPQQQPVRGRLFNDSDAQFGAPPVAIIGYDVWQSYYAGRDDIIGLSSRINGEARTIVGVMPAKFQFPISQSLWLPLSVPATANAAEGKEDLFIVGKLQEGTDLPQASVELNLLQASLIEQWPEQYRHITLSKAVPYVQIQASVSGVSILLVIFAAMVLLIAFNISNLFLARSEERLSELAIRSALGASASRVGLTLLLESFIVCCLGLCGGLLLAAFFMAKLYGYISMSMSAQPFWIDYSLNGHMVAVCALTVCVVWLISGGLPAWRMSRRNLDELLRSSAKGLGEKGVTRTSKVLVNLQLVLGCTFLTLGVVSAVANSHAIATKTTGAEQLYLGSLNFRDTKLPSHPQQQQYLQQLQQVLLSEQGVQQAAFASAPPGGRGPSSFYTLEEEDLKTNESYPSAFVLSVSANYFSFFNLNLLEGREFNAGDSEEALPVVIIDQNLASKHWPTSSALGKRIQLNPATDPTWYTVIGVSQPIVQDARLVLGKTASPVAYRPTSQAITDSMKAVVRMASTQVAPASFFRAIATRADRDIPITDALTLRDMEVRIKDGEQINSYAYALLIFLALYVTSMATYGLATRIASRRRLETGIRMALGANRAAVFRVFIKDGFKAVAVGLGIGSVIAIALGYVMLQSIASTAAFNLLIPVALIIGVILGSMVMLANYFPARRLVKLEPADALRYE
jgi:predicted permease